MNTLGHELAHALDSQRGVTREGTTASGQSYSEEYANIMGAGLEDYAEFAMYNYTDDTLATTNTHNGMKPPTSVFDPNYDQATQNFENRVDAGEVDYRQLAKKEIQHIQNVSEDYAQEKGISQEEAYNKLYDSAMYAVDSQSREDNAPISQEQQGKGFISATNETQQDINSDIAYLQKTSQGQQIFDVYDEDNMHTQDMFTATEAQFNDPNYNPDNLPNAQYDLANLLLFTPVGRVANTAVKGVARVADDVALNIGSRINVDNIVQANDFISGFDAKYPKPNVKKPFINAHTIGYGTREMLKRLGN